LRAISTPFNKKNRAQSTLLQSALGRIMFNNNDAGASGSVNQFDPLSASSASSADNSVDLDHRSTSSFNDYAKPTRHNQKT